MTAHKSLRYSDDGVQLIHHSADPELPMAAFTIGSPRPITFERAAEILEGGNAVEILKSTETKRQL